MPTLNTPHDKMQAAHDRAVALATAATNAAQAAFNAVAGGLTPANIAAAFTAAYQAAIAGGATPYEADIIARAVVARIVAGKKLGDQNVVSSAAVAGIGALVAATAAKDDPCNLSSSVAAAAAGMLIGRLDIAAALQAYQYLIDNNG